MMLQSGDVKKTGAICPIQRAVGQSEALLKAVVEVADREELKYVELEIQDKSGVNITIEIYKLGLGGAGQTSGVNHLYSSRAAYTDAGSLLYRQTLQLENVLQHMTFVSICIFVHNLELQLPLFYNSHSLAKASRPSKGKVVEKGHGLEESLLLGILCNLVAHVAADSKAVDNARVEVDLVGLLGGNENLLGLVAALGREDGVGLGSSNGKRAGNGSKLVLLDKRGVGEEADVDAALVVADDVLRLVLATNHEMLIRMTYLGAEAVANGSNLGHTGILKVLNSLDDNRVDMGGGVALVPGLEVKVVGLVQGHRVAVKQVDNKRGVALLGKGIGHEPAVLPHAKDIRQVEDGSVLVCLVLRSCGEVGVDGVGNLDVLTRRGTPSSRVELAYHVILHGRFCIAGPIKKKRKRLKAEEEGQQKRTRAGYRECSSGREGWKPWLEERV